MWVRKFRQENTEKKCQNNYYHICYIVTELTSFTKKHIWIELKWDVFIVGKYHINTVEIVNLLPKNFLDLYQTSNFP